jgi:hypothetical protein
MGSDKKLLRFYDAEKRHDIPADRWELQLRESRAEYVASKLSALSTDKEQAKFIVSVVFSSVDFRIGKVDERNLDRLSRPAWWQEMCDRTIKDGVIRIPIAVKPRSIQRSIDWIKRQVSCTLLVLRQGMGARGYENLMASMFSEAFDHLTNYHDAQIQTLRRARALSVG